MNHRIGGKRFPRAGVLVTALTGIALVATGCGTGGKAHKAQAPVQQTGEQRHQQALAWAKCMRQNGTPDWPDPDTNGAFPNNNGSLTRIRKSAGYTKASSSCKNLEVSGGLPPAEAEKQFEGLLKYSQCMRQHGISKFPDPIKDKSGVGIQIPKGFDETSAAYKAAQNNCKSLKPR
jgi:hypothetical protein